MSGIWIDIRNFFASAPFLLRRLFSVLLLIGCSLGLGGMAIAQDSLEVYTDQLKLLTPEELDKAARATTEEMFIGTFKEPYQPFARDMIRDGKTITDAALKIGAGKSDEVLKQFADATPEQLEALLKKQFPDPDHPARRAAEHIKGNTEAYKAVLQQALNGDRESVAEAIIQGAKSWTANKMNEFIDAGVKIIKDNVNDVAPGAGVFKRFGTTYLDATIEAGKTVADATVRLKDAQDARVFDCYGQRYRKIRRERGASAAREFMLDFGIVGYDCPGVDTDTGWRPEGGERSVLGDFPGAIRDALRTGERLTTDFGALATNNLDPGKLIDLLEEYEDGLTDGSIPHPQPGEGVTPWIKARTAEKRSQPKTNTYRRPIPLVQLGIGAANQAGIAWEHMKTFIGDGILLPVGEGLIRFATALWTALGEARYNEVGADYLPADEVKIFAEGIEEADKKKKQEKEDEKNPEEVAKKLEKDLRCDPDLQAKSNGGLDDGFIAQDNYATRGKSKDPEFVDEDGCRPYGEAPDREEKVVYQYEAPPKPDNDPEPELTRCAALDARVDDASSRFSEGRIKDAHAALGAVISDIAALPGAAACVDVKKRAEGNRAKLGQLVDVMDGIKEALTSCEPGAIGQNVSLLKNASNVRLVALRNRMKRSLGVAQTYADAKQAFRKGDMEGSESLFRQALAHTQRADGRTCKDIAIRINANIKRIGDIKEIADIGIRAADSCDIRGIEGVIEKVRGATNPFLDKLYDRLAGVPEKCEKNFAHDACRSSYGSHARMNEAVGRQADGTYQCQCANGYKWKPGAEGKDKTCIPAKQADKLARQQASKWCSEHNGWGYYASRSRDGSFQCIETKKRANQLCRDANPGKKVRAGKRLANGEWTCHYVNPPPVAKKRAPQRRQTVTRRQPQQRQVYRQPQYDPQAAARVLQGLQQLQQGIQGLQRQRSNRRAQGNPCPGGNCVPTMDIPVPVPFE